MFRLFHEEAPNFVADVCEVFKARIQLVEYKDGHRGASVGIVISRALTHDMSLRSLERENSLRLLVLGNGEVIFRQSGNYSVTLLVKNGDIEKDQSRGSLEHGDTGRGLLGRSIQNLIPEDEQEHTTATHKSGQTSCRTPD